MPNFDITIYQKPHSRGQAADPVEWVTHKDIAAKLSGVAFYSYSVPKPYEGKGRQNSATEGASYIPDGHYNGR